MNLFRGNSKESQQQSGAESKEFTGLSSISSGPFYRSLPFENYPGASEPVTSSLPFEPKYRSLGFDSPDYSSPPSTLGLVREDSQYHALNSQTDRSVERGIGGGGGVDLSMPSFSSGPGLHAQSLNPKLLDWGQDQGADFQMPNLKGLKDLPPVGLGATPVYTQKQQSQTSPLQQNLELVNSAPNPPELPVQFEVYSSFWSSQPSAVVWPEVLKYLHENANVDFVFQPKRNKIKATIVQNGYAIQFYVRIFGKPAKENAKWNKDAQSLVECQRRSGDAFEFNAFFKSVVETMRKSDKNVFLSEVSPIAQKLLPAGINVPATLKPPSLGKSEVSLDQESRKSLYSMAVATHNTEAQREALRMLSSFSAHLPITNFLTPQDMGEESSKLGMAEEEISLEQVLHCALTSRDSEVRRGASTLLANISRQKSAQSIMSAALIHKLFALLEQEHLDTATVDDKPEQKVLPAYMMAETKRQVAKAISGLSTIPTSCKVMASQPDYIRLLRQQSEMSGDQRLGIYADAAVTRLTSQMGMSREIFV